MADLIQFDLASGQRIASAVRVVEGLYSPGVPLKSDPPPPPAQQKRFRIATFTGSWSKGATKTVTFKYQSATPNTAVATNLFANVTNSGDCAIARDGTAWFLIAAECSPDA